MDAFRIVGGNRLSGTLTVSGSKNAALPQLAALILADAPCTLWNVPNLMDIRTMLALLQRLGVEYQRDEAGVVTGSTTDDTLVEAPYDLVKQMRASICVLGPLLARRGKARVSLPGGCVIGERPVDLHLRGLEALGARISIKHGYIEAVAPPQGLRGTEIYLGGAFGSSVTATDNVLCAAVLAKGTTIIECAACEPEVVDLANMLIAMGARITGAGSPRIVVEGVERLTGCDHSVIPDRIEAATFISLAAATESGLAIDKVRPDHLLAFLDVMKRMGVSIDRQESTLTVRPPAGRPAPCDFVTLPYPAFPTDCQAQTMVLAAIADGASIITERIYPDRFMHASELKRMGADITVVNGMAVVKGRPGLSAAPVMASDLRASAALVSAALAADGESTISRIYHIDRGYEDIESKLRGIGADITRFSES
jgi:UDP-N-acetylglucosamine 1-carboxyvinyltransferase